MGALLHEREYIRDVPTPILYGSPGTGKSFLVSLYNKLLGAENMGYLSASKLFAFQDLVNKRLGAFEDIE
jgi:phage/plasmid-associated DNA primase